MSTLPDGAEQEVTTTVRWKVWSMYIVRDDDGEGVDVTVRDRLVRAGVLTDEYRTRALTETETDQLWRADARMTFPEWIDLINVNAD